MPYSPDAIYTISATPELWQTLGKDHYFSHDFLWKTTERLDSIKTETEKQEVIEGFIFQTKLEFLLNIIARIRKQPLSIKPEEVEMLFGSPPEFSIGNFDKWWTIRRSKPYTKTPLEIWSASTSADIAKISTKGYSGIKKALRAIYEEKRTKEQSSTEQDTIPQVGDNSVDE